ncbi:MAG: tetratricopeptide repeat protein [candidate division WOR-3 bacterium]|nr:tetratricopeptide repeat protein [candidate division WOR-3 bacterium]
MLSFRRPSLAILLLTAVLVLPAAAQQIPLDALMRGGRIHYEGQRYDRAKEQFTKALTQYGATADNTAVGQIHFWLGLTESELHNYGAAADHFVTAMEKDTTIAAKIRANEQWQFLSWTALISATRESYNAAAFDPALNYALAALKVDPSKSQTYALVANIYSALSRYDEMRAVANDLLKLDAGAPEAFSLLGLYFLQKPDSLWPSAEAGIVRWDSAGYYYDEAIKSYEKRFAEAQAALAKQLKLDPARLDEVSRKLIEKSRLQDQAELKRYIETDLNAAKQLPEIAQDASKLFYAANNLNVASSRAGTAMLRAAAETRADTSERFRARAEALFGRAVEYDSSDFTSLFDLGITQYQGKKDSLAEISLQTVINGAVVGISVLPQPWLDSVLTLVTPSVAESGYVQISGLLAASVDSVLIARGRKSVGYSWLYFPDLKTKKLTGPATLADTAGMFLSLEPPRLMEQSFLWLGSSQTGLATTLSDAGKKDAAKAGYERAIVNLLIATKLEPKNSDAFQNLGICYREIDQKDKALKAFENADKLRKQGH